MYQPVSSAARQAYIDGESEAVQRHLDMTAEVLRLCGEIRNAADVEDRPYRVAALALELVDVLEEQNGWI
jgi:hypothetical protein